MKITANFSLNMGISPRRDANRRRLGHGWHNNAARLVARFAGLVRAIRRSGRKEVTRIEEKGEFGARLPGNTKVHIGWGSGFFRREDQGPEW
jgi:hypothetical protein